MKILVISDQYWPESWRITEICEALVTRGFEVTVVAGLPNNSSGQVFPEYRHQAKSKETRNGVVIMRTNERGRKKGALNLYRKYQSFSRSATKLVRGLPGDFDLVLVNQQTPIMQCLPGIEYARQNSKPLLYYCQDLWPASLEAGGIHNAGLTKPIYAHYLKLSRTIYQQADRILVTSPGFISYLEETCQVNANHLALRYQYAEDSYFNLTPTAEADGKPLTFLFAGNIGKAQSVETLIEAAARIEKTTPVQFLILGDGSRRNFVEKKAQVLKCHNVTFLGKVPSEKTAEYFSQANVLVLTLSNASFTSSVLPAKLTSYAASGKPILVSANGSVADVVSEIGCGFASPAENVDALVQNIQKITRLSWQERAALGAKGREFAQDHFKKEAFMDSVVSVITQMVRK
jgi:Glycosyltransferase